MSASSEQTFNPEAGGPRFVQESESVFIPFFSTHDQPGTRPEIRRARAIIPKDTTLFSKQRAEMQGQISHVNPYELQARIQRLLLEQTEYQTYRVQEMEEIRQQMGLVESLAIPTTPLTYNSRESRVETTLDGEQHRLMFEWQGPDRARYQQTLIVPKGQEPTIHEARRMILEDQITLLTLQRDDLYRWFDVPLYVGPTEPGWYDNLPQFEPPEELQQTQPQADAFLTRVNKALEASKTGQEQYQAELAKLRADLHARQDLLSRADIPGEIRGDRNLSLDVYRVRSFVEGRFEDYDRQTTYMDSSLCTSQAALEEFDRAFATALRTRGLETSYERLVSGDLIPLTETELRGSSAQMDFATAEAVVLKLLLHCERAEKSDFDAIGRAREELQRYKDTYMSVGVRNIQYKASRAQQNSVIGERGVQDLVDTVRQLYLGEESAEQSWTDYMSQEIDRIPVAGEPGYRDTDYADNPDSRNVTEAGRQLLRHIVALIGRLQAEGEPDLELLQQQVSFAIEKLGYDGGRSNNMYQKNRRHGRETMQKVLGSIIHRFKLRDQRIGTFDDVVSLYLQPEPGSQANVSMHELPPDRHLLTDKLTGEETHPISIGTTPLPPHIREVLRVERKKPQYPALEPLWRMQQAVDDDLRQQIQDIGAMEKPKKTDIRDQELAQLVLAVRGYDAIQGEVTDDQLAYVLDRGIDYEALMQRIDTILSTISTTDEKRVAIETELNQIKEKLNHMASVKRELEEQYLTEQVSQATQSEFVQAFLSPEQILDFQHALRQRLQEGEKLTQELIEEIVISTTE